MPAHETVQEEMIFMAPPTAETLGDHGARIYNLEKDVATARTEYRDDMVKVFAALKDLQDGQVELKTLVTERATHICSAVSTCAVQQIDIETLDKQVDSLRQWRNVIVGGSMVAWLVICVAAYMLWDWVKSKVLDIPIS